MAEIIKVFKEHMPELKLIGKRYGDKDRDRYGSYSEKWQEWFQRGYFNDLKQCGGIERISDDYVGMMRLSEDGVEYWIGVLMSPEDTAPEGFESVLVAEGDLGVCYVYGKENSGELFGMDVHNDCMKKFAEQGWKVKPSAWFVERYNCPRYTVADQAGTVILDYCAYID